MKRLAGWMGAFGVAMGAFGAHGIKDWATPEQLEIWKTAAHYHQVHAVVLLVLALWPAEVPPVVPRLFTAGILIFSGSLYALVIFNQPKLGMITPIGGLCLIGGWALLARSAPR